VNRTPIYCPAGWKKINIDFEGNIFTCMSAVDRSKLFHSTAMPHYSPIANIFDDNFELQKEPILCWESFRCSACDYQMIKHSWTPFKNEFNYQLPIPE
jgi:radical SAM protein with 4Fe4S-binding SPASM domain